MTQDCGCPCNCNASKLTDCQRERLNALLQHMRGFENLVLNALESGVLPKNIKGMTGQLLYLVRLFIGALK
jgi:hypothetical protein